MFPGAIRDPEIVDQELTVDVGEEQSKGVDPFVVRVGKFEGVKVE